MASKPPGGATLINSHEDLLTAFSNIDQRLHRIIAGDAVPYIYRNKLYLPASMYNIYLGSIGSGGERNTAAGATGSQRMLEDNSVLINSTLTNLYYLLISGQPLTSDAAGNLVLSSSKRWNPIASVVGASTVITADGAGNIGSAADVIAAQGATAEIDAYMICQVDTTGSYTTKWCEDPTGTPAVGDPDYHTAGHIAYMVAGYPYILREMCPSSNVGLGYDAGVNGNWPNSSNMYITGYFRSI